MDWQVFWSSSTGLVISGFLLDLVIGDPRWVPHPVVLMGKVISYGEQQLFSLKKRRAFLAGMALIMTGLIAITVVASAIPPLILHPCD